MDRRGIGCHFNKVEMGILMVLRWDSNRAEIGVLWVAGEFKWDVVCFLGEQGVLSQSVIGGNHLSMRSKITTIYKKGV